MRTRLRYWRTLKSLTIAELAEKASISINPIINMERHGKKGYPETRRKLAEALEILPEDLFTTDDDPNADGTLSPNTSPKNAA